MRILAGYRDNGLTGSNQLKAKGLTGLRHKIPRRVIRTTSQRSAAYADQSNYSYAREGEVIESAMEAINYRAGT
jgi:hypothetical protein